MKTLGQIKDEIAVKHGYLSFHGLLYSGHLINISKITNELLILVQKECLKNASENAYIEPMGMMTRVDKQSITNENNIIR